MQRAGADCARMDAERYFFLHIPKAAGTTLGKLLERRFMPEEIFPPYWLEDGMEAAPRIRDTYRYFRGHFTYMDMRTVLGERMPICITMLRDPIDRFISQFAFFQHTRATVDHYVTFADFPSLTLADYARDAALVLSTESLNPQTRMIGGDPIINTVDDFMDLDAAKRRLLDRAHLPRDDGWRQLRIARQRLDTFAFVGLTERFQESLRLLSYTFGWRPVRDEQRLNVTPRRSSRREISPKTLAQITSYNTLDLALYAHAQELFDVRYRAMIDDLARRFGGHPPFTDDALHDRLELHYAERFAAAHPREPSLHIDFTRPVSDAGWHDVEFMPDGSRARWTGPGTTASIDAPIAPGRDLRVTFRVLAALAPDILERVSLRVNDVPIPLSHAPDTVGGTVFAGRVPREALGHERPFARIVIGTGRTMRPVDFDPASDDERALGVLINWIDLEPTYLSVDRYLPARCDSKSG